MGDGRNQCCLSFQRKGRHGRACAPDLVPCMWGLLSSSFFSWGRGEVSYEDDAPACIDTPSRLLVLSSSPPNPSLSHCALQERPSSRTQGPVSAAGGGCCCCCWSCCPGCSGWPSSWCWSNIVLVPVCSAGIREVCDRECHVHSKDAKPPLGERASMHDDDDDDGSGWGLVPLGDEWDKHLGSTSIALCLCHGGGRERLLCH